MAKVSLIAKSKDDKYFEFYVVGIDVHILNMLRRILLSETVTLAIHDIYIYQNTSVLPDEVLAQRLGLIPLRVDPTEIPLVEEARATEPDLDRLLRFTARLRLKKANMPKDNRVFSNYDRNLEIITVYSGDLEAIDKKTVRPVYDKIPIVRLGPGQEVDIECVAKVGRGKDHAKFSPVSTVAYKIMPILKVSDACDACGICVDACPFGSLYMELGKPVLRGLGRYKCTTCRICVRHCPKNALEVHPNYGEYIFRLKLVGQLTIEELLDQAKAITDARLDALVSAVESQVTASNEAST